MNLLGTRQFFPFSCHFFPFQGQLFSLAPCCQTHSVPVFSFNLREQVSHPYKAPSEIIILASLISRLIEKQLKGNRFIE
jgi:hypothetical protein